MAATLVLAGNLISLIGVIIVVIQAFKSSVLEGVLALCLPFYVVYFIYKDWDNDSSRLGLYFFLAGCTLNVIAILVFR